MPGRLTHRGWTWAAPAWKGLLLVLLALFAAACRGDGQDNAPEGAATPASEPGDGATVTPTESPEAQEAGQPAVDPGAAPVTVEAATFATGLEGAARVALAADGMLVVATADGAILAHEGGGLQPVAQLDGAGEVLGLAAGPERDGARAAYALVAAGETGAKVRRVRFGGEGEPAGEVAEEAIASLPVRPSWGGNALRLDGNGDLYAAVGEVDAAGFDAEAVAERLRQGAPPFEGGEPGRGLPSDEARCREHGASIDGSGPWQQVAHDDAGASGAAGGVGAGAAPWMPARARAATVYAHTAVPQWSGSLLVVSEGGSLLQIPTDEAGCLVFEETALVFGDRDGAFLDIAAGGDGHVYALSTAPSVTTAGGERVMRIGALEGLGLAYPDLRTAPPSNLVLDTAWVAGQSRHVLRFTNLVMNMGEGPLELRQSGDTTMVMQRVYAADGSYLERPAGQVVDHWSHGHWHFEDFNRFELWTREDYERMAAGASDAEPRWVEPKVSMCLMDLVPVEMPTGTRAPWRYGGECEAGEQGISVGWGDIYLYDIPEQWVVLGDEALPDGEYVLRSVVDGEGILHESAGGADEAREGRAANSGAVFFTVSGGGLTVTEQVQGAGG